MLRDIVDNNALLLRYNERELYFVRMAYGSNACLVCFDVLPLFEDMAMII